MSRCWWDSHTGIFRGVRAFDGGNGIHGWGGVAG